MLAVGCDRYGPVVRIRNRPAVLMAVGCDRCGPAYPAADQSAREARGLTPGGGRWGFDLFPPGSALMTAGYEAGPDWGVGVQGGLLGISGLSCDLVSCRTWFER